jgi:hypothetical protein
VRRFVVIVLLMLASGIAVSPIPWYATSTHAAAPSAKHCTKKTKIVKGHRVTVKKCPKAAVKTAAPTSTPTSTPTVTPSPTATFTSTSTSTPTPTATLRPPSVVTVPVQAQMAQGDSAYFVVCGLPRGASASFTPDPAASVENAASPLRAAATSQLAISVPFGTDPSSYALNVSTYFKNSSGTPVSLPTGGAYVSPSALVLLVGSDGGASLSIPSGSPLASSSNCSPMDNSFKPAPTPTPSASDVVVGASMSNQFPALNDFVKVTGKLTVRGQAQYGALMTAKWYFPFSVGTCTGVTDGTGQASCGFSNTHVLPNYPVQVQVSFNVNGTTYYGYTVYYM